MILADDSIGDSSDFSRTSSNQSLASTTLSSKSYEGCSLDEIPACVLERIIAYLPVKDAISMERASKRCMEASIKSWSLVSRLLLSRDCEGFGKNKPFRNIHLKSLDVSGIVHLMDDKALGIIGNSCPFLEELDLSGVRASWEALGDLSESLSNLKKLIYKDMENAGDKQLWFLIKGCARSLRFLDLRGCFRLHGRCFRLFGDQLEHLFLDGCQQVDETAIEDLCTSAVCLKELRINNCCQISDENVSLISRMLSELQVITLCGNSFEKLSTAGIAHIGNITSLVELALDHNPLVNDAFLISISKSLKNLKTLSLANSGLDQTVTGKGIIAIAQLKTLEQLDLSSLGAVRSGVLLEVVYSCRSLSLVQLRNCVYLSDHGVKGMARAANIRHLDLSGSILITNDSVQDFIKAFPQDEKKPPVTIVVGGTAVEASRLTMRGSRVIVDSSDYSSLMTMSNNCSFKIGTTSDDDYSDNEFEALTTQRSFYIDAKCGEEEQHIEDEQKLQEWVEGEARNLGLLGS
ncbi:leucine Rich repeat-containing domain protein [Dictyocaulus viviparus]|uniref:Leucine Rich repeat-containing domain protein n=1 Tax=Dictyocaulus viviparus TaxID=29172 RepID=A0A0D8XQM9_DICVI|nr:leucine Rich repeat-containing domain protein [Dictyocaulus viviparus]